MTGKTGSNLDLTNPWKLDGRVKTKLKGTFFKKLSHLVGGYKQRTDLQTFIQTCFDKRSRTFTFGKDRNIALYFGLEDVYYITGLPVDGEPVVCNDKPTVDLCNRLLGASMEDAKKEAQISKKWLRAQFEVVPEGISEDQLNYYVRAYMLYLFVTAILPNCDSTDDIPAYWLQFIEDLNPTSLNNVAWGAAAHVMLITNLSRERNNVKGPYWMLEMFFFERISMISKKYVELPNGTSAMGSEKFPKKFPLFCYWVSLMVKPGKITAKSLKTDLETIRDQMKIDNLEWQPYAKSKRYQRKRIFFSRVVLFNFDQILYHEPEKGARQLNINNVDNVREQTSLKIRSKRGYTHRRYLKHYANYIQMWREERYLETRCIRDSSCAFELPPSPENIDEDLYPFITDDEDEDEDEDRNNGSGVPLVEHLKSQRRGKKKKDPCLSDDERERSWSRPPTPPNTSALDHSQGTMTGKFRQENEIETTTSPQKRKREDECLSYGNKILIDEKHKCTISSAQLDIREKWTKEKIRGISVRDDAYSPSERWTKEKIRRVKRSSNTVGIKD